MEQKPITTRQIALMAVAAGTTIANVYYEQPILSQIAATTHVSASQAGHLPALTQAGSLNVALFRHSVRT
jgi:predicted MFS family arabinose efflux permease